MSKKRLLIVATLDTKGREAACVCSHLGCLVDYDKVRNRIFCPCHAAVFDLEGNVVTGPPPKPLQKLPLRVEGESIVIG